ncbi:MAG: hypothetical protein WCI47_01885 [bacterium]
MLATPRQYIGVTGFMTPEEIAAIQAMIDPGGPQLMVGLLASAKTLRGKPARYPNRYPEPDRLSELLGVIDSNRAFGLIHYSAGGVAKDLRNKTLYEDCSNLLERLQGSKATLSGFQFNQAWPYQAYLFQLRAQALSWGYDRCESVLQLGPALLYDRTPEDVADQISLVYDVSKLHDPASFPFTTLLYDVSGGEGKALDLAGLPAALRPLIDLVQDHAGAEPVIQLAVAGGLDGSNVAQLRPLVYQYPKLSIDAEGRLRDPETDTLNLDAVKRYVEAAQVLFAGVG